MQDWKVKGYEGLSKFNGVLEISRHTPNASKENSPLPECRTKGQWKNRQVGLPSAAARSQRKRTSRARIVPCRGPVCPLSKDPFALQKASLATDVMREELVLWKQDPSPMAAGLHASFSRAEWEAQMCVLWELRHTPLLNTCNCSMTLCLGPSRMTLTGPCSLVRIATQVIRSSPALLPIQLVPHLFWPHLQRTHRASLRQNIGTDDLLGKSKSEGKGVVGQKSGENSYKVVLYWAGTIFKNIQQGWSEDPSRKAIRNHSIYKQSIRGKWRKPFICVCLPLFCLFIGKNPSPWDSKFSQLAGSVIDHSGNWLGEARAPVGPVRSDLVLELLWFLWQWMW